MPRFNRKNDNDSFQKDGKVEMNSFSKLFNIFSNSKTQKFDVTESLIQSLEAVWDNKVAPVLIQAFGRNTNLYAIFYQGKFDEVILEVWDPRHVNTKKSQIFNLRGVSKDETDKIAKGRDKAVIISIDNWS